MTQSIPEFDIAIIGAGIAGSALACALRNSDLRIVIIEGSIFPENAPLCENVVNGFDARVSALTLSSKMLFEKLHIWSEITALRAESFSDMFVWDGEGTAEIAFNAGEISEIELGYIVENRVIVYSLLESLKMCANIKMLDKTKVRTISPIVGEGMHRHTIQLESGREIKAELIVGADGANSLVREVMGFKTREWDYHHQGIVCTVETEKYHQKTAWQRFSHSGPIALLPLSESKKSFFSSLVWSAETSEAERLMTLDDVAFAQALTQATEAKLGKIGQISPRFCFPLRQRHALEYVKTGVALIADAAHTIHPLAGQGINLGLQDVEVLAEELLRAKRLKYRLGDIRVLSRYQRRRKGENLLMMVAMEGFKHLFEQQSLAVRVIRNRGMESVAKLSFLKKQIMKQAMGVK